MASKYRNKYELETAGFTPAVFTPIEHKPLELDYNTLNQSFAKQEERNVNATKQLGIIKETLGKAKEQLVSTPENQNFIEQQEKDITNNIQNLVNYGDADMAYRRGIQLAADFVNNTEFNQRLKDSNTYKTEEGTVRARQAKGDINDTQLEYWYAKNELKSDTKGQQDWKPTYSPTTWVEPVELAFIAAKFNRPDVISDTNGGNTTKDADGNIILSKTQISHQYKIEKVQVEELKNTFNSLFAQSGTLSALKDERNVLLWKLQNILDKGESNLTEGDYVYKNLIDNLRESNLIDSNNKIVTFPKTNANDENINFDTWFLNYKMKFQVNPLLIALAYKNELTGDESFLLDPDGKKSKGSDGGGDVPEESDKELLYGEGLNAQLKTKRKNK